MMQDAFLKNSTQLLFTLMPVLPYNFVIAAIILQA